MNQDIWKDHKIRIMKNNTKKKKDCDCDENPEKRMRQYN